MSEKKYSPQAITSKFYQIGTPAYPAYLSLGEDAMILEAGIGATWALLVEQVNELGIPPERIKYIAVTHTHPDHVGALPQLRKQWPGFKIVAGAVAAKVMKGEEFVKEFMRVDGVISENLLIKGEIKEWPTVVENPAFDVDIVVKEGDTIDLGKGTKWVVYETPGHSSCHTSYYNPGEGITVIADATGLYDPERDLFWPNYFDSLEGYCNSIRKLYALPAQFGALSHNGVIKGDVRNHFRKALAAAESFHSAMLKRVSAGEDPKKVTLEMAKWAYTFTNMQPFETIYGLTRLMLKRSQAVADKKDLFNIP